MVGLPPEGIRTICDGNKIRALGPVSRAVMRVRCPPVRVPVLSDQNFVPSQSSRPGGEAGADDGGGNWGMMSTAIVKANSTESITGRRSNRLVTTMVTVSVIAT